jgi:tetratricopeptide (TPR) repeat protein
MARRACLCSIPLTLFALLFLSIGTFAQNLVATPTSSMGLSDQSRRTASAHPVDPTMEAISKAEQEGRLLDAEKLLTTAVYGGQSGSAPDWRMSALLNSLARVEFDLGRYSEAIAAMHKALVTDKAVAGPESTKVLLDLDALAVYNRRAGNQAAVDRAIDEALELARKSPGPHQTTLVTALWQASLNDRQQHREAEAQALLAEGAGICQAQGELQTNICPVVLTAYYREGGETGQVEKILSDVAAQGPVDYHGHPDYGYHLNALSQLAAHYQQIGSYSQAEAAYQKAITVVETHIPNPLVAPGVYEQYGRLLELEGKNKEAEAYYRHAFEVLEGVQGKFRAVAIERLSDTPLVSFYQKEGRTTEAEAILGQVVIDQKQVLDQNDAHLARTLVALAGLKFAEDDNTAAEPLCERALKIQESDYGTGSLHLVRTLSLYAAVERHLGNKEKADALATRASALRKQMAKSR